MKRAIQKELETPLGRRVLRGEIRDGQTVAIDVQGGDLTFAPKATEHAETTGAAV